MKKILLFAGLMTAAAISLTNCQPAEINIEPVRANGHTYRFTASTVDTKTTNSGMSTLWQAYDSLTVIYASAGADNYVAGEAFVDAASDGSTTASFSLEAAPTSAQALDWYVLFPYMNRKVSDAYVTVKTPAAKEDGDGWMYVGHSNGAKQDAYNSTAHLSKSLCPMYGIARNVSGDEVGVTMKHLTSVIEFNVVNNSGSTLKVKSVTLSATEDVVGSYFIDITGETPVFTPSGENYVYNNAEVYIENPGELAASQTAKFYLPIKPYTHDTSKTFDVFVVAEGNGSLMTASFNLSPAGSQAVFSPGKIKKVTLNLTSSNLVEKSDAIADAHNASSGAQVVFKDVLVSGVMKKGFFVTDNTDIFYVYLNNTPTVTKGQKVKVKGQISVYRGNKQIASDPAPDVTVTGSGTVTLSPVTYTGADVEAAWVENNAKYVKVEATGLGTATASVEGTEKILYIANNNRAEGVTIAKGKKYTITGYVYGKDTDSGKQRVYVYAESAEEIGGGGGTTTDETLTLSPSSLSFEQEGGTKEVTVTSDNENWTVDASTVPEWLTADKSTGKITFTATANEETKRSATVTVKHANGTLTANLKISQTGAVASDNLSLNPTSLIFDASPTGPATVEVTSNDDAWTIDSETVADWLTVDRDGNTVTVSANPNSGAARTCTVKFHHATNTSMNANLVVNQKAPESSNTVTYTKVTSASAISSGRYLVVYEDGDNSVALDGSLADYSKANYMSVTISGSSITVPDGHYVEYDASANTLKTASGLYLESANANSNGIYSSETIIEKYADNFKIVLSYDTTDNVGVVGCTLSDGEHRLRWNASSKFFRFYKPNSTMKNIQLYKQN